MAAETAIQSVAIPPTPHELERQPLVHNQRSLGWISDAVAGVVEGKTPKWWWIAFIPSVILMTVCFACIACAATRRLNNCWAACCVCLTLKSARAQR